MSANMKSSCASFDLSTSSRRTEPPSQLTSAPPSVSWTVRSSQRRSRMAIWSNTPGPAVKSLITSSPLVRSTTKASGPSPPTSVSLTSPPSTLLWPGPTLAQSAPTPPDRLSAPSPPYRCFYPAHSSQRSSPQSLPDTTTPPPQPT